MDKQIRIEAFHKMLNSTDESESFFEALRKLTQAKGSKAFTEVKGSQPLGFWAGWPMG